MMFAVEYDGFRSNVIDFVVAAAVSNIDEGFLFPRDLVYSIVLGDNQHLVLMVVLMILLMSEKIERFVSVSFIVGRILYVKRLH